MKKLREFRERKATTAHLNTKYHKHSCMLYIVIVLDIEPLKAHHNILLIWRREKECSQCFFCSHSYGQIVQNSIG